MKQPRPSTKLVRPLRDDSRVQSVGRRPASTLVLRFFSRSRSGSNTSGSNGFHPRGRDPTGKDTGPCRVLRGDDAVRGSTHPRTGLISSIRSFLPRVPDPAVSSGVSDLPPRLVSPAVGVRPVPPDGRWSIPLGSGVVGVRLQRVEGSLREAVPRVPADIRRVPEARPPAIRDGHSLTNIRTPWPSRGTFHRPEADHWVEVPSRRGTLRNPWTLRRASWAREEVRVDWGLGVGMRYGRVLGGDLGVRRLSRTRGPDHTGIPPVGS